MPDLILGDLSFQEDGNGLAVYIQRKLVIRLCASESGRLLKWLQDREMVSSLSDVSDGRDSLSGSVDVSDLKLLTALRGPVG